MFKVLFAVISAPDYTHVAVPAATEQAMSYYHSGNILWIFQWVWSLIIPLLFLATGVSGKLGAFVRKIWEIYLLLKKSPRRWWFYSGLISIGIAFNMMFINPIWIDPLFNDVGPMKDKQLEQQLLNLASRAGIEDGRIFEVDKSKDTKMGNAYVSGLGSTKRIVIWDTSIKGNDLDGILFIIGHEMGHYVLYHNWLLMGYFTHHLEIVWTSAIAIVLGRKVNH